MSEQSMVERVARVVDPLAFLSARNYPDLSHPFGKSAAEACERARETARAAIAAMREPTRKQVSAGFEVVAETRIATRQTWRAMIDAALKED